jgi:hypothetical protein
MAKKSPSELNTRTIRITIGDYALLSEISRKAGVTMAEAFHLAFERRPELRKIPLEKIPITKCPHCGADTPLDSVLCVKCWKRVGRKPK